MQSSEEALNAAIKAKIGDFNKIGTHMSNIYLGEHEVIKTLKSIDLGFVDLRPIEKRRDSSIKAAKIDKAYSPDLNTRVVTVVSSGNGHDVVEGLLDSDNVVDYGIAMRRFDSSQELKELYKRGQATGEHAKQIGNLLADAHQKAETTEAIANIGFGAITGNFDECFAITEKFVGKSITKEDYDTIKSCYHEFVDANKKYLEKRRDSGFIKQCHGDAHSGNMFVEDGTVKIFDGIGFKDEFSYMDTVADLAFAYMDAVAHGRDDLAEIMKGAYVKKTKDAEGVGKLLDFYVSYRAFVKGEVTTMKALGLEEEARKKDGEPAKGNELESEIHDLLLTADMYFGISRDYALKSIEKAGGK